MVEVSLRDPNSEVVALSSHLGFSTLSIKCLFVCGRQEVKRGTVCQVSEWCNEGLGRSQGLFMFWQIWDWGWLNCRRLPAPFEFSSLLLPFACLHFLSVQFHCLSFLNLVSFLLPSLNYILFFSSFPEFLLCRLFPLSTISVSYCPSYFPPFLCQSCWMFLVASCSMSLPSYALCYWCLTHTKGSSPGLDANQVSPSLFLDPWRFQIHKW